MLFKKKEEIQKQKTICAKCKHYSSNGKFDHNCFSKSNIDCVTGDKIPQQCSYKNEGNCFEFEELLKK